jgi:hypothetical protein
MASQRQIEANRRNAQNSTGPRTEAGKERSKRNALKHGLRSEEVVLPTEDPLAFKEHLEAWVEDWQPPSMARRALVEQAAVATWRLRRCIRLETARITSRIEEAYDEWEARERAELDETFARLEQEPEDALAELMSTRAGVDRLIEVWSEIEEALATPDGWCDPEIHHFPLVRLHGLRAGDDGATLVRQMSWRLTLRNRGDIDTNGQELLDDEGAERARGMIARLAEARLRALREQYDVMPDDDAERDNFAELAGLAPRPEDAVMFRYEAQQNRVFKTSLDSLIKLSKTGADVAPNEPNASEPVAALAPNEAKAVEPTFPSRPSQPAAIRAGADVAPNEPKPFDDEIPVDRVKRGPDGGIWSTDLMPIGSMSR